MRRICIFCGSKKGKHEVYQNKTRELGQLLVQSGIGLVYGGGGIGLMGILADEILQGGGKVTGVIPRFLSEKELGHANVDELILVDTMHQRKQKMAELADGFIALPGGYGTLEEFCEILTWNQLQLLNKPVGVLNINGYFNHLLALADQMVAEGFLNQRNRDLLIEADTPDVLLKIFKAYHVDGPQGDLDIT